MNKVLGYRKMEQLHNAIQQFSVKNNDSDVSVGWFLPVPSSLGSKNLVGF